ncbi:MAG TPA: ATP-dependent protease ATPase subunit HslU [candidate division Zixibacteria bacterium]|nr:ATP-dependent protease ATPase subunit HslU [candidate division Zixibacteria bacterium]
MKETNETVVTDKPTDDSAEPQSVGPALVSGDDYLTPKQIVAALDRYIVGQDNAKKSVAIALRNRWRRRRAPEDIREDILPNNIIMIGPTGVGKTEIARRLADLVGAPFVKVEASKFTEVGYVGRDVESIVRDLVDLSVNMVKREKSVAVESKAAENTTERLLDLLLPRKPKRKGASPFPAALAEFMPGGGAPGVEEGNGGGSAEETEDAESKTREKFRAMLEAGKLDHRKVEITVPQNSFPVVEIFTPQGMEEMGASFQEMFSGMMPKKTRRRTVTVAEARKILQAEEAQKLVNMDDVVSEALQRAQESGIVFLDEIDKIAGKSAEHGPDVSREGVQRDILPVVEGSTVSTKYGMVRTDHVLFIAAGAFHVSSPSDLIPELQGRFPIRVELDSLTAEDFERILTEPKNALVKQYQALLASEGVKLTFTDGAIKRLAELAERVNTSAENIGARRLHTIVSALLEEIMFDSPGGKKSVNVTEKMVGETLKGIVEDEDLSRYML